MGKTKQPIIKLTVELVPSSCWWSNLRDILSIEDWQRVRSDIYRQNNYVCEICGGRGVEHPVECHEKWEYDYRQKTQKLIGLFCLCPACHEVKHIGLAGIKGRSEIAQAHLKKINKWTQKQTTDHVEKAFEEWAERSRYDWRLDLTWLREQYDVVAIDNRVANKNICDKLDELAKKYKNFTIKYYTSLREFIGNYKEIIEQRHVGEEAKFLEKNNVSFLAFNISNFHWVLIKVERMNKKFNLEYYDPKRETLSQDLLLMLEALLQAKPQLKSVPMAIDAQLHNNAGWLPNTIEEIIASYNLFSQLVSDENDKMAEHIERSGLFNTTTEVKQNRSRQPKIKLPISKKEKHPKAQKFNGFV